MMDVQDDGILVLLRSVLEGRELALPEGFELEAAYPQLRRHQIMALAYLGAVQCGIDKKLPVMQNLFRDYCLCLQRSEEQMQTVEAVYRAFDKAGVDYMPLKGCNLKALYPAPELRIMGDADILIRTEQYDKIRPLMEKMGFAEGVESDHELVWHSDKLFLELHKRLIPSYNRDYYRYFGDGWRLASMSNGTRYAMKPEDEFIYLFTHFAKHYRDGGIGVRHLLDLHVFLQANKQLDMEYVLCELDKLQLRVFFEHILRASRASFCDGEWDDVTKFIVQHIFFSGAYGTAELKSASEVVRLSGQTGQERSFRFKKLLGIVFLPYGAMTQKYAVLRKLPILLPVFWGVRGVSVLISKRKSIQRVAKDFQDGSAQKANLYRQALNYVGLDFNFEE